MSASYNEVQSTMTDWFTANVIQFSITSVTVAAAATCIAVIIFPAMHRHQTINLFTVHSPQTMSYAVYPAQK